MNKSNVRRNTKSKQKRQHTNSRQPAIVVKDASVPARDEKLSVQTHYSASTRMGENTGLQPTSAIFWYKKH